MNQIQEAAVLNAMDRHERCLREVLKDLKAAEKRIHALQIRVGQKKKRHQGKALSRQIGGTTPRQRSYSRPGGRAS